VGKTLSSDHHVKTLEGFMRGLIALLLAIIVGAIAGAILFAAENIIGFALIIAFPAIAGLLIGFTVRAILGNSSGSGARILSALAGGLVALVVYWGGTYIYYESTFIDYMRSEVDGTAYDETAFNSEGFINTLQATFGLPVEEDEAYPTTEMIGFLREGEAENYGTTGFPAMLAIYAESGIGISRSASSTASINLTGALAYGLWIVEALVLLGVAVGTSLKEEKETTDTQPVFSTPQP
jgi:hypothetical protein